MLFLSKYSLFFRLKNRTFSINVAFLLQQDTTRAQLDQSFHSAGNTIVSVETVRAMESGVSL
jgi:hypothetical protein